jgi:hypothetical protein
MFFKHDRFLRGLRLFLALDPGRIAIGEVVIDAIETKFLPELEEAFMREPDEGKRNKIQRLIDIWVKYGNRNSAEGRSWSSEAAKVISAMTSGVYFSESMKEELAADVTELFYRRPAMRKKIHDFDYEKGPKKLMSDFLRKVRDGVKDTLRSSRKFREMEQLPKSLDDDDGDYRDIEDTGQSESEWERGEREIKEVIKRMGKWVKRKLPKDAKVLYNLWEQASYEKGGPDRVNLSRDILPTWTEATGKKKGMMAKYITQIKKLQVEYLKEKEKLPINQRTLRNIGLQARVAVNFWMPRMATWLLEIYREKRPF